MMNWRQRLGAFIGGFDAGQHHRRLRGFRATRAHVNALIAASGPDITARARWLVRNNGYAVNAVESWAAMYRRRRDQADLEDRRCRAQGGAAAPLARLDRRGRCRGADRFLRAAAPRRARGVHGGRGVLPHPHAPRGRRADRAAAAADAARRDAAARADRHGGPGNAIRQGIEFDRIGRRVAYHFLRRHPGDSTDPGLAGEVVRVPASEVIHVIDPVEGGQLRGVSLAPAIVKLFLLDQYDDAELDRKKVAAMFAMFVTSPAPETRSRRPRRRSAGVEISPGQIVRLDPGEDVTVGQPAGQRRTYEPFQYRTLLQISAALGIPYPYLANDMVKGNFSNSRLALIEFRRRVSAWQHSVMVWQLCRPVWARWMDMAVLSGALDPARL
jgi:capsid protein